MLLLVALVNNLAAAQVNNVGKPVITKKALCSVTFDAAFSSVVATNFAYCWRVQDQLHVDGIAVVNASGVGAGQVTLTLPTGQGYVIDAAKIPNTATDHTASAVGPGRSSTLDVYRHVQPMYASTTTVKFLNSSAYLTPAEFTAAGKTLRYKLELPIVGW